MKVITIEGVIGWEIFADDIRKQLPTGSERIRIDINSPGGDVFEAFAIYNALKEYPGRITARVVGLAASAAADLFFGADEREAFTHSAVMYHRAWTFAIGNAEDLKAEAEILNDIDSIRIKDFARVTGKSLEAAMQEFTNETWLIGSDQINAKGISVKVVDDEEDNKNEKPVDIIEAKARVAEAKKTLHEIAEKENRQAIDCQKIAALAREIKQDVPAQAVADNSLTGGAKMDFSEFIAQNPGAEGDILAYARPKIGTGTDEARKAESDRILKILVLAGVKLTDDVKQNIADGLTPEAYAFSALTKQREIEAMLNANSQINPGKVAQGISDHTNLTGDDLATNESVIALAAELKGRR